MPGLLFKLTNAGRAALVNPDNTGTVARQVVSVGIATAPFVHDDELIKVPSERAARLTTVAGETVANDTIHVSMTDHSTDQYTMYGFGLYLDNGVLLGTYGQETPILEKSPAAMMMLATDIVLTTVDAAALTFGDASFLNPPATTTVKGVVELADNDETQAGTDNSRAVTPASLASRTATDTRAGLVELATINETQAGTDNTRAVTPAGLANRTATESRAGLAEIATQAEVDQGSDDARFVTPKKLLARILALGFGGTDANGGIGDMDDITLKGGLHYVTPATLNIPFNLGPGVVLHRVYGLAGVQLFFPYSSNRVVFRRRANTWQSWQELALLDSPTFSGTPTVPTAPKGTTTKQAASTEFVMSAIADLVDSSPGALDTLKELAAALGNDPNFATTVVTELGKKFDKTGGVVGNQTTGWEAPGAPTMRVVDLGTGGTSGGLSIESYSPVIQFVDRTTNERSGRIRLNSGLFSLDYDTATPGAYAAGVYINPYAGSITIGGNASYNVGMYVRTKFPTDTATGTNQYGAYIIPEFNENCSVNGYGALVQPYVKDAPFTMGQLYGYTVGNPSVGAQANVRNYHALVAFNPSDFPVEPERMAALWLRFMVSAAVKNKWNIYIDGDAPNYLRGKTLIGSTSDVGPFGLQVHATSYFGGRLLRGTSAEVSIGDTSIAGIANAGGSNDSFINTSRWSNDAACGGINIGKSRGAEYGTQGALLADDYLGRVNFAGSDGTQVYSSAQIEVRAAENFSSTARGTHMDFRTTGIGAVDRPVRMRISGRGNVLIGTTTDDGASRLQVAGYATVDTPPEGDRSRKVATTEFVMRAISSAAIGTIILEPRTTARAGCLLLNGALLKRADYPELWAYAQASGNLATEDEWMRGRWGSFSAGDGATTFRIPEYRGEFLRIWDAGRGVDAGRYIGGYQAPMNMSHAHSASAAAVGDHNHTAWTDAQGWHSHDVNDPGHAHTYEVPPPATNPDGQGAASGASWLDLTQYVGRGTATAWTGIGLSGNGSHGHNVGIGWAGAHTHPITVNADGGAEVRVRNVAVAAMIRAF